MRKQVSLNPAQSIPLERDVPMEGIERFPVTYTITKEQRQILLHAIGKAKRQWGLKTSAEAIVQICDAFLN